MMRIVCLGGSFTGLYLASRFERRVRIAFLTRKPEQLPLRCRLPKGGLEAFLGTGRVDAILDTVPALSDSRGLLDPPYLRETERILEVNPSTPYLHLSSTSVYPSWGPGERQEIPSLDESSPAQPTTERGRLRLALEKRVSALFAGSLGIRSAGIYGPGRCLALRFQRGDFSRGLLGNQVVSRIHVHDLCRIILALASGGRKPPSLVNAVDRRPAPNAEVFRFLEGLLKMSIPGDWRGQAAFGRRISSLYAASLLGGSYRFPTYREGFRACLE